MVSFVTYFPLGPPVIVVPPKSTSLNMSQNALLRCQAVADPPNMTYVWQKGGENVYHVEWVKSLLFVPEQPVSTSFYPLMFYAVRSSRKSEILPLWTFLILSGLGAQVWSLHLIQTALFMEDCETKCLTGKRQEKSTKRDGGTQQVEMWYKQRTIREIK